MHATCRGWDDLLLMVAIVVTWCLSILILPETGIEGEHTCGGGAYFSCCSTFWQQCRKSQRWCYQMYRRRARRESMMLLLKVLVTSIEGVDDSPSYAVATSKEGVNDAASGDKHGSACEDSKDEVECKKLTMVLTTILPASMEGVGATKDSREQSIPCACEQRQQGRARGCIEGFDDGATEDSDNHVKLLPCSDIPPCDNKEMLKVILSVDSFLKTKQDCILCVLKDALTECGVANNVRHLECQKVHHFTLPGFHPLLMLHLRHVEGCCLLKSTSTLNLAVLVSHTLLTGGPPWSHTLALLVLEWRSLAISLLTLAMKFSICGGRIICLQQVGASRNIPSKALLGSSRSIEGSWFFFGFFVSAATTSLGACWFLMMLSRRVEEMTSWLMATSSSVTACPS
ncbi:uncharacterized protein G2W53_017129 [Senna tora]|uniref:Uncharacterized protein n=1 Tax=Senna tora TaxID=362788 RepID=A0A834WJW4_9FABA|nr:uncharacterized protein G2W53_017129 [Senna tora]